MSLPIMLTGLISQTDYNKFKEGIKIQTPRGQWLQMDPEWYWAELGKYHNLGTSDSEKNIFLKRHGHLLVLDVTQKERDYLLAVVLIHEAKIMLIPKGCIEIRLPTDFRA